MNKPDQSQKPEPDSSVSTERHSRRRADEPLRMPGHLPRDLDEWLRSESKLLTAPPTNERGSRRVVNNSSIGCRQPESTSLMSASNPFARELEQLAQLELRNNPELRNNIGCFRVFGLARFIPAMNNFGLKKQLTLLHMLHYLQSGSFSGRSKLNQLFALSFMKTHGEAALGSIAVLAFAGKRLVSTILFRCPNRRIPGWDRSAWSFSVFTQMAQPHLFT
jgi:hypothetical protein